MARHEWKFLAGVRNDSLLMVAVCRVCGLMRRRTVADDRYIDLRGECPGEPQEPETQSPPMIG
jgi:hypothetical protein